MQQLMLSFDLEEFDIPREFGGEVSDSELYDVSAAGLDAVLNTLQQLDIQCTFFTTARYAITRPEDMARIINAGHEVASHAYEHSEWNDADLQRSRDKLEEITNAPCMGFRRPRLMETDRTLIQQAGYKYNSSENPIWLPGRYNNRSKPRTYYRTDELLNIPISATPTLRAPLFWLAIKNFPMWWLKSATRRTARHDGYLNLFFHPWEFTDLKKYTLPSYVKRHAGQPMLDRMSTLVNLLKAEGEWIRMDSFRSSNASD